ncbi:hypothetical protein SEK29439_19876 [Salmonella enterica subsp. enterica serovar Kentucky str. 29439]|nr:hypothetical protein SEK29439_19876 [Salmonella enterica subsp. enterica serovar Kentucky str. 29439]
MARGNTFALRLCHAEILRFIPAGAGNTKIKIFLELIPAVYPRWRGEHASKSLGEM